MMWSAIQPTQKLLDSSHRASENNRCREAYHALHEEGLPAALVSIEFFATGTANSAFLNTKDSGPELFALTGTACRPGIDAFSKISSRGGG
jgi:hypothetical protein